MHWRKILVFILLLGGYAHAQPVVGINSFFAYPFDMGKQGYYNRPAAGFGITGAYWLPKSNIYPSASINVSYVQQPIYSGVMSGINAESVYKVFGLSLNYKLLDDERKKLTFFGGINAVSIAINSLYVYNSFHNIDLKLVSDGVNYLYPGIHGGLRYSGQIKKFPNLYWTTEANVGYIKVFESNNYRLVNDSYYEDVTIAGNVLNPAVMLGLQYAFETRRKYRS